MGLDTIPDREDRQVIDQTWYNVLRSVMTIQFFPRNSSGVVTPIAGSLGSLAYTWSSLFSNGMRLSANGNLVTLKPDSNLGAGYSIKFPTALPGGPKRLSISPSGDIAFDDTAAAFNFVLSASCGSFSTTSTSRTQITNFSNTITTLGRPVFVGIVDDGTLSGALSQISVQFGPSVTFYIQRVTNTGSVDIATIQIDPTNHNNLVLSGLHTIDIVPAGTYTYNIQVAMTQPSSPSVDTLTIENFKMITYEV